MSSKRDILLHRNHYFLRIKQAILLLLCGLGVIYSYIKHFLPLELQYAVLVIVALIALVSLIKKDWLIFLLCATGVLFNLDENLSSDWSYIRSTILAIIGLLGLIKMEMLYVKDNFGLTLIPPGWGTLRPKVAGSTGRFLSLWELAGTFKFCPGGIFIGRPLPEQRLFGLFNFVKVGPKDDRHMLTIAGSRGGKGTAAIIPNLLLYPGSVIAIDPKGELATVTAARRGHGSKKVKEYLGQDVFVFDPENNVQNHKSASWNPLEELDLNDPYLWSNVERISAAIVPKTSDPQADFFNSHARTLLTALIIHAFENEPPEHHNLIFIRQLIMEGDQELYQHYLNEGATVNNAADALYEFMSQSTSHGGKIARTANNFLTTAYETRSGIIGALQEQTDFLDNPGLERYLQSSDFSLKSIKQSPTTLYLCLKSTSLATPLVKILSLFLELSIIAMESCKVKPKHNVLFIIDEFYALGRNETIDVGMGLFAGFGITLWPILQNISQLKTHYPNNWQTFIANCRGVQIFNEQEPDTLKWLEERCGTKLEKRPDGSFTEVPLLSINALNSDYLRREDRRQLFIPQGRPVALLELMDYYKFSPKHWYNVESDIDSPNPNPNQTQVIKLTNTQSTTYLPAPSPPLQQIDNEPLTEFVLSLSQSRVYKLYSGVHLSTQELPELNSMSADNVVAVVISHPNDPDILGLKNLSDKTWNVYLPNGSSQTVVFGKSIKLADAYKISLGSVEGEINLNPFFLNLSDNDVIITLTFGKTISSSDIPSLSSSVSSGIIGEVRSHPEDQSILGLSNLSTQTWTAILTDGSEVSIDIGKSIPLADGIQIDFGIEQGVIDKF